MAVFSPWKEAFRLLEESRKGQEPEAWAAFKSRNEDKNLLEVIYDLKQTQDTVSGKYSAHGLGRSLERLELLRSVGGEALQYAPQTVGIAFTAFSVLCQCVTADMKLCETIGETIDNVTHWIFVGEVYAKQYSSKSENPPVDTVRNGTESNNDQGSSEKPSQGAENFEDSFEINSRRILEKIPPMFAVVLHFCFEIEKLGFSNDSKVVDTDQARRNKSHIFSQLKDHAKAKVSNAFVSFHRHVEAFFGKGKQIQGILGDGTKKLKELDRMVDIAFKSTFKSVAENLLMTTAGTSKDLKATLDRITDSIQESQKRIEENQRKLLLNAENHAEHLERMEGLLQLDYHKIREWLRSGTVLELDQPFRQHQEIKGKTSDGTCDWIFGDERYTGWIEGHSHLCWLSGETGLGKSFITSSVVGQLLEECHRESDNSPLVIYFFCKTGKDATRKSEQIVLHLIMQLLDICDRPGFHDTQRDCVEIIQRAKDGLSNETKKRDEKNTPDALPMKVLRATFLGLVKALHRKVFVVVDAVDECSDRVKLLDALSDLVVSDPRSQLHLWISSRPEDDLSNEMDKKGWHVEIKLPGELNESNLRSHVGSALKNMTHITKDQQEYALSVIIKQSFGSFLRATTAINLLKDTKAVSDFNQALKDLPADMDQLYQQLIQRLPLDYRNWLSTALRWLICGDGEITATLIADEIEHKYLSKQLHGPVKANAEAVRVPEFPIQSSDSDQAAQSATEEGRSDTEERPSITALRDFARDFLKFTGKDEVQLRHTAIRDWVLNDEKKIQNREADHCRGCLERMRSVSTYRSAPKYGHLLMAVHIMKTLNSRTFQERHLFRADEDEEELRMIQREESYPETTTEETSGFDEDTCIKFDPSTAMDQEEGTAREDEVECEQLDVDVHYMDEDYHEGSRDDDATDVGRDNISDAGTASSSSSEETSSEVSETQNDQSTETDGLRYELTHWGYHVRMAEQLWSPEERSESPYSYEWSLLYSEIRKFMDSGSPAFRVWQKRLFPEEYSNRLYYAAYYGLVGVIEMFLNENDDPSERNEAGDTPLHASCMGFGEYFGLEYILERSREWLNDQQNGNLTPVMLLIDQGAPLDKVKLLVTNGARLDLPNHQDWYSLHYAIRSRSYELCEYILENKISTVSASIQDGDGETPLHWLLKQQNASIEIADLLIRKGAKVCAEDLESQQPLYEAACTGNVEVAEALLRHGADVNDTEIEKWTALHKATAEGHADFVRLLLAYNAEVTMEDSKSRTSLHLAAKGGRVDILEMILDHLAIASDDNFESGTCGDQKHVSGDSNRDPECAGSKGPGGGLEKNGDENLRQPLSRAAALEQADKYGNTPLHKAAAHNEPECVKLLLNSRGVKQLHLLKNTHGATPLHSAAARGYERCVKLLLDANADPNSLDHKQETPLHSVVKRRDIANTKLLLEAGADPNLPYGTESKATILDTVVQEWQQGYDWEVEDEEEFVVAFVRCARNLSEACYFNILNIALERQSKEVICNFTTRLTSKDRHDWTLLSLAIQFREKSLLDCVFLPKPSSFCPVWSEIDRDPHIAVSDDGKELCGDVSVDFEEYTRGAVRTDLPIPPGRSFYYYEVEILEAGESGKPESIIGLGFCSQYFELDNMPGWGSPYMSWGYHGDDGWRFGNNEYGEYKKETFGEGDVVGAGVDFSRGEIFFTKNGINLGVAFSSQRIKGKLFAIVGFFPRGIKIRANFGADPFKYSGGESS